MATNRKRASRPKHTKNADSETGRVRHALRMTQRDFAAIMGVSVNSISKWESGAVKPCRTAELLLGLYAANLRLARKKSAELKEAEKAKKED